jgi:hypothetical protein
MMSSFLKDSYSQNNNTLSKEFQNKRLSDIILDRSDWTNPSTGERYKLDISINQAWQNGIELNKTF